MKVHTNQLTNATTTQASLRDEMRKIDVRIPNALLGSGNTILCAHATGLNAWTRDTQLHKKQRRELKLKRKMHHNSTSGGRTWLRILIGPSLNRADNSLPSLWAIPRQHCPILQSTLRLENYCIESCDCEKGAVDVSYSVNGLLWLALPRGTSAMLRTAKPANIKFLAIMTCKLCT